MILGDIVRTDFRIRKVMYPPCLKTMPGIPHSVVSHLKSDIDKRKQLLMKQTRMMKGLKLYLLSNF